MLVSSNNISGHNTSGVGKTSLLNRYVENLFSDQYHSTVGVEFGSKMIEISDTLRLKLQIWDTVTRLPSKTMIIN